ncbi:MAG: hypothetical protein CVV49_18560 [Spirochaetae bacterium HGW-Spirochaetae-5]|nr:MAG: hypothetical protein CVV49_18560 [Spirochaetae bacterium HGW-Spirochaetae-5]
MMKSEISIKELSSAVASYTACGLSADVDTLNFIRSAYGLNDIDEISAFITSGDDSGTVIDLVSYPDDDFRESVEKLIPPEGLALNEIQAVENILMDSESVCPIIISRREIILSVDDSRLCRRLILKRLNLQISLNMIDYYKSEDEIYNYNKIRSQLRKRKFKANEVNSLFINDLIYNYKNVKNQSYNDFTALLEAYFYENAIMEAEEFSLLMKTYSMEFIMMKRIQPPLITIEEARLNIKLIDRMTSIVYGMIIPSVNNVMIDSF